MRKTRLGCTILEGHDVADLPLVSENAEILEAELERKMEKVTGKGLSTNDYTTAEKNKLAGIAANANNYVHPGSGTNPHGTTKADLNLDLVQNYAIATKAQAEAGTANNVYMTPIRVKEAVEKFSPVKEDINIYIPDSSLHPVITVSLGDYGRFYSSGSLNSLGADVPRKGWFVMNLTGMTDYPNGFHMSCEWKNLQTHDLLYLYSGVSYKDEYTPIIGGIFKFNKGSSTGGRVENRNNDRKIILGSFTHKKNEPNTIRLGKEVKHLRFFILKLNDVGLYAVNTTYVTIEGEIRGEELANIHALVHECNDGSLKTYSRKWLHFADRTEDGFVFKADFDFFEASTAVFYEAII